MQRNASNNAVSTEKKLTSGKDQRGRRLREEFSRQSQNFDLPVFLAQNLVIQIEDNFGFKWILAQMDSMNIHTNMELEHQDMLTRNLGLRKKKLLQLSTPFFLENNKLELRNCFSKLGNEFETGLNNYQKLLDEIQGGPTVNLNNLTVLLSRLDFLEKIKTPTN